MAAHTLFSSIGGDQEKGSSSLLVASTLRRQLGREIQASQPEEGHGP
ncbi:hypothetical protein HMPREF1868_01561, partial [Olsenella sp. DNF00959]